MMKKPAKTGLMMLRPDQLAPHPENVRRRYVEAEVLEMAASISARGGVIQALEVVPSDKSGIWWVKP